MKSEKTGRPMRTPMPACMPTRPGEHGVPCPRGEQGEGERQLQGTRWAYVATVTKICRLGGRAKVTSGQALYSATRLM